jgi:hypothetical protein
MTDGLARPLEKRAVALNSAQCTRAHYVYAVRTHVQQALAEAFQSRDSAGRDLGVEAAVVANSLTKADHFAQSVDDDELVARLSCDHHVEAIGA